MIVEENMRAKILNFYVRKNVLVEPAFLVFSQVKTRKQNRRDIAGENIKLEKVTMMLFGN